MKNNKKIFILGTFLVLSSIIIIGFIFLVLGNLKENKASDTNNKIKIFYEDKTTKQLSHERFTIPKNDENFIENVFEAMKSSPKSTNLKSVVPKDMKILYSTINDSFVDINFSGEYSSLSNVEKILFRSALVWSITENKNIKSVKILIDGEELTRTDGNIIGYLDRNNVLLNPTILPDKIETASVLLYFTDINGEYLIPEERAVAVRQSQNIEYQIMEQLIEGSVVDGNFRTVPMDTKIRNMKTELGICYVDLSSDFVSKHSGEKSRELTTIYSIVNSLTHLDSVNKVQFLIEGEKSTLYKDSIDISKPLDKNEKIILD